MLLRVKKILKNKHDKYFLYFIFEKFLLLFFFQSKHFNRASLDNNRFVVERFRMKNILNTKCTNTICTNHRTGNVSTRAHATNPIVNFSKPNFQNSKSLRSNIFTTPRNSYYNHEFWVTLFRWRFYICVFSIKLHSRNPEFLLFLNTLIK